MCIYITNGQTWTIWLGNIVPVHRDMYIHVFASYCIALYHADSMLFLRYAMSYGATIC